MMKNEWPPLKTLAAISEKIDYGFTASAVMTGAGPRFLRITDIQNGSVEWDNVPTCVASTEEVNRYSLRQGDIVFARTGATTGKSFLIRSCPESSIFASYLIRVRPRPEVDPRYLAYFFDTPTYWCQIEKQAQGAGQPGVNASKLQRLVVPLPAMAEQKRIADILDKADAIRKNRQESTTVAQALVAATFREMFGNLATNEKGWREFRLNDILRHDLRNGVSPTTRGDVPGKVLVLSAITGSTFEPQHVKVARFAAAFELEQLVNPADLLVCRGNGNRSLVGCGRFPSCMMYDTVFPDTMIAASVDHARINSVFFEHLWSSTCVRQQVASGARTTNGTYKINQQVLGAIEFPLPPIAEQEKFARFVSKIDFRARFSASTVAEELFDSLIHHAFGGEL